MTSQAECSQTRWQRCSGGLDGGPYGLAAPATPSMSSYVRVSWCLGVFVDRSKPFGTRVFHSDPYRLVPCVESYLLKMCSLCTSVHTPVPVLVFWQSPGRVWRSHSQSRTWRLEQAVLWELWRLCYHSGSFNSNSFSLLDKQQRPRVCALTRLCCRGRIIFTACSNKGDRDVIRSSSAKIWHNIVYISFDLVLLMHKY